MAETKSADLLIIGGGISGTYAAYKAKEKGLDVLLTSKSPIARSGGTMFAGTLAVDLGEVTHAKEDLQYARLIMTGFIGSDVDYFNKVKAYIHGELMPELEKLGVYFLRTAEGSIVNTPLTNAHIDAVNFGLSGRHMADIFRCHARDMGVRFMEEAMATSLITSDGRVTGATFLDFVKGEFVVVRAKATVLATGHGNYFANRSTATRELCGDGWAIAYRAGAELANLEMNLYHVSDMAWPKSWMRVHVYPNPLPLSRETSRLVNNKNELFWETSSMSPTIAGPYHIQLKRLIKQVEKGNARFDGDYYSTLSHIKPETLAYVYHTQFYQKLGLDVSKDAIENAVTFHYSRGGLLVNSDTFETNLHGLYAIGGAACNDGALLMCYDSKAVVDHIAEIVDSVEMPELDMNQVSREENRVLGLLRVEPAAGPLAIDLKKSIRHVISEKMGPIKDETQMREALEELGKIRELATRVRLTTDTRNYNYEWVDALDVFNMLDSCELYIRACLIRKESRLSFYRSDYPYTDNENWLKRILIHQKDGKMEFRFIPSEVPKAIVDRLPKKVSWFDTEY